MFRVNTSKLAGAKSATDHTTNKSEQTAENTLSWALETSKETVTSHQYNKENKVLIICGPTATGKTKFALDLAKEFNGELISADSRQVYTGRDLIYGKDIPPKLKAQNSKLKWEDRYLKFYQIDGVKIWLYDIVEPQEPFSVALWRECAQLVIVDIRQRGRLPIVVGGTGLYIKSLTQNLSDISVSRNPKLRQELQGKDVNYLFNYLKRLDHRRAEAMNESDRQNPRRLVRAIEIASPRTKTPELKCSKSNYDFLQIGLTAPRDELYRRVNERVDKRIAAGAAGEDSILSANPQLWRNLEHKIVRQQLTWFKKQPEVIWFDIIQDNWHSETEDVIGKWYNNPDAKKD